jgi:hypothetical protein
MGELVYEMLWDCTYCSQRKLLGLTHRHCPNCGAPQAANARYFPSEADRVAVQDHQYFGADLACRYCGAASSNRAHHCGRCGAPLTESAEVQPRAAPASSGLAGPPRSEPPRRPWWKLALPVTALVTVVVVVLLLVWKKDQRFVAASNAWHRSIEVERLGPSRESAWCDELPAAASEVSRRREPRRTKQVPDGEDCRVERKDLGDGTFQERRICQPKLRSEPVYDDKCEFVIVKWSRVRQVSAEGPAQGLTPHWPEIRLNRPGCSLLGCEREGARAERYSVTFKDERGDTYRCDFPERTWSRFVLGKRYRGQTRALVGSLDCASLRER